MDVTHLFPPYVKKTWLIICLKILEPLIFPYMINKVSFKSIVTAVEQQHLL